MTIYRALGKLRHDVAKALGVTSSIVVADITLDCYTKRVDGVVDATTYAALDLGTPYQVTLAPSAIPADLLQQAIKLQQRRIYSVLRTPDNTSERLFCIDTYLTLADGCVAINGYTLRHK